MMLLHEKKFFLLIIFIVVFFVCGFFFLQRSAKEKIIINGHTFFVDIADTQEKMKKGLSGRKKLCKSCGMLFLFDEPAIYTFWMKDMLFDIDIVWIKNGMVIAVSKNVSYQIPQKIIIPPEPITAVLELSAGVSDDINIEEGDSVIYY